ncbi:MAG: glycosyltransferase [Flavobacteriales bacterium]|nr:glycosyltransferase [Flavobacteriales bacterium]
MGKRIGLQTWGSDGDILPFLTLAKGLVDAGHTLTIVCTSVDGKDYSKWGERDDFRVIMVNGSVPEGQNLYALTRFSNPLSELSALLATCYDPLVDEMYAASVALCRENDLVIGHVLCHTLLTASEKFGCPRVALALSPMVIRTVCMTPLGFNFGRTVNGWVWDIGGFLMTGLLFGKAAELRRKVGLPAVSSLQRELFTSSVLTIVACSEALCLRPADWGRQIRVTGFLNVPSEGAFEMDGAVSEFLKAGPPPVYMTFGTCMQFDREANLRLCANAARLSGQRAIIQADGAGTGDIGNGIFIAGRTSHAQIFPHCSVIVHHGGAGTTQSALLAGRPSVVVAHAYDQHDWAKRLHRAGVGARPLNRMDVHPKILASAIGSAVTSEAMKKKAAHLGEEMSQENGVQRAVALIEVHLGLHTVS